MADAITAIPFGLSVLAMWLAARSSDRTGERKLHACVPMLCTALLYTLTLGPESAFDAGSGLDLSQRRLRVCLDSRFLGAPHYHFNRTGQSGIDRAYQCNRKSRRVSRTRGHWTIADPNPFRHGPGLTGCTILLRGSRPDKPGAANAAAIARSRLIRLLF